MKILTSIRAALAVSILVLTALLGLQVWQHTESVLTAIAVGGLALFVAGNMLAKPNMEGRLCATLTVQEILMDVIEAFAHWFPAVNRIGTEWRPTSLKLNKQYTAHIPSIPSVEDVSTTYALTGQTAKSLLTDVDLTVNKHKACLLNWSHFDEIKDDKNGPKYLEVVGLAGYALAKAVIDDILTGVSSINFSQTSTFTAANGDLDMLIDVNGDMNVVGALPIGRFMICNTGVANALDADSRVVSKDYYGHLSGGNSLRNFKNIAGFADIFEYPTLSSNNGTALTSVTAEADDDLFTKAAHGLTTGQRVVVTAITGGTGVTAGTAYFVINVSSSTFKLATTRALAIAGTAIDITVDGSAGTITPTENLVAFAGDRRAISFLGGIPDGMDMQGLASALNVPLVMNMTAVTHPQLGITMAAVGWQDAGTGKLNFAPTLVWGKALGAQGGAAGTKCDYAGHMVISS